MIACLNSAQPYVPVTLVRHPHGTIVGSRVGTSRIPLQALAMLHPLEREAAMMSGQVAAPEWVAGRIALKKALADVGIVTVIPPILSTSHGAPETPEGFVGSITHKGGVALALAARDRGQRVGIDLETMEQDRGRLATRVLRGEELQALEAVAPAVRSREIVARFSIKEAVYKALHGFLRRPVDFTELTVGVPLVADTAAEEFRDVSIRLHLSQNDGDYDVAATCMNCGDYVVSTAEVRPHR